MANRDQARPGLGFRRFVAITLAAGLGLAAVCLVVFGTTQKQLQVGVLLGLWGGLTAAFLVFGSRRGQQEQGERLAEAQSRANQLHEAQVRISELQRAQQEAAAQQARISQEVVLRRTGEVELSREVAARREADYQLELSLRREIEQLMSDHIGALRTEVAALRAEVVDKLGGQLRLERIETTRVIGSDLEALQHEIRRLAGGHTDDPRPGRPSPDGSRSGVDSTPTGAARWPVEQPGDIVDAEVIEAAQPSQGEGRPSVHRFEESHDVGRSWSPPTVLSSDPAAVFGGDPAAVFGSEFDQHPEPSYGPPTGFGQSSGSGQSSGFGSFGSSSSGWSPTTFGPTTYGDSSPEPAESTAEPPAEQSVRSVESPVGSVESPVRSVEQSRPVEQPVRPVEQPVSASNQSDRSGTFAAPDPFAGLPRLSPLPPDLDLIQDAGASESAVEDAPRVGRRRAPEHDEERYHGRRRAPDDLAGLPER